MKQILIVGAGRSSWYLIDYLLKHAANVGYKIRLGDYSFDMAQSKSQNAPHIVPFQFDIHNSGQTEKEIKNADLVISMLPAHLHIILAQFCLKYKKNLTTASYISDPLKAMDNEAKKQGIIMLMECGLDPGLDHMSAMKIIDEHRNEGYFVNSFETFTGGLLAPSSTVNNPWEYKFTWNPRNVVLAGQGTVKFLQEGEYKYIPYHKLFRRTEIIHIPELGFFEGYANRDSLKYLGIYGLKGIQTLFRGTLRRPGFCKAWDVFVQLGATDDSYEMEGAKNMTHRQFINSFLSYNPNDSVELKLAHYLNVDLDSEIMYRLKWLGLFDNTIIGISKGSPAQILEHILQKNWALAPSDKDMIVMYHRFTFTKENSKRMINSYLTTTGESSLKTAMAKTVGLPLGIASLLILTNQIKSTGVIAPINPEIYNPILAELEKYKVKFEEEIKIITP